MAYSTYGKKLLTHLDILRPLANGDTCRWQTPEPRKLAFNLRELLWQARNLDKLNGLDGAVVSEEQKSLIATLARKDVAVSIVGDIVIATPLKRTLTTVGVGDATVAPEWPLFKIISKVQNATLPFTINSGKLSPSDLTELLAWLHRNQPSVLMFYSDDSGHLTFQPFSDELAPLAFDETDLEELRGKQ